MKKYCPNCGTQLNDDDLNFCPECGYKINEEDTSSKQVETLNAKPHKQNFPWKKALITTIVIALASTGIYIGYTKFFTNNDKKSVQEKSSQKVKDNDSLDKTTEQKHSDDKSEIKYTESKNLNDQGIPLVLQSINDGNILRFLKYFEKPAQFAADSEQLQPGMPDDDFTSKFTTSDDCSLTYAGDELVQVDGQITNDNYDKIRGILEQNRNKLYDEANSGKETDAVEIKKFVETYKGITITYTIYPNIIYFTLTKPIVN